MVKVVKFACPKCKNTFNTILDNWLCCDKCKLQFPIKRNIPILNIENAEPLQYKDITESNLSRNQPT